jgi:hypothetical protein
MPRSRHGCSIDAAFGEPGFTRADLNHNTGTQTVEQGAEVIVRLALLGADGPAGTFQSAAGLLPW